MLWKIINYSKALALTCILMTYSVCVFAQPSNANHLVSGILSYVTWDASVQNINFCIIDDDPKFITQTIFSPPSQIIIQPPYIKVFNYLADQFLNNNSAENMPSCNVLYFTSTPDDIQQKIINLISTKTLSISEKNPNCVIGSAFCIYKQKKNYHFKVNLDSLKKSQVHVSSKVLFLSQTQEEK